MEERTKKVLELFIKKADKLKSRSFIKYIVDGGELTLRMTENAPLEKFGPDDEAAEAFIPTFRLFFQDSNGFSFKYLDEVISNDHALSEYWKQEVRSVRNWLNQFLDGPSLLSVNSEVPTRRNVMDVFFYGDLLHTSTDKKQGIFGRSWREQFELWEQQESVHYFYQLELASIMFNIFHAIMHVSEISKKEIESTDELNDEDEKG